MNPVNPGMSFYKFDRVPTYPPVPDERTHAELGQVSISTMHRAKGLEFHAMAVVACDDEVASDAEPMSEFLDDLEAR